MESQKYVSLNGVGAFFGLRAQFYAAARRLACKNFLKTVYAFFIHALVSKFFKSSQIQKIKNLFTMESAGEGAADPVQPKNNNLLCRSLCGLNLRDN